MTSEAKDGGTRWRSATSAAIGVLPAFAPYQSTQVG
jgi:hypothetical protein